MYLGKYTTIDFDTLSDELREKYYEICKQIEADKTSLSELGMLKLEALVWFYRLQLESFDYQPPECFDDEKLRRFENMRLTEIVAHIFQRRANNARSQYEEWLSGKNVGLRS